MIKEKNDRKYFESEYSFGPDNAVYAFVRFLESGGDKLEPDHIFEAGSTFEIDRCPPGTVVKEMFTGVGAHNQLSAHILKVRKKLRLINPNKCFWVVGDRNEDGPRKMYTMYSGGTKPFIPDEETITAIERELAQKNFLINENPGKKRTMIDIATINGQLLNGRFLRNTHRIEVFLPREKQKRKPKNT